MLSLEQDIRSSYAVFMIGICCCVCICNVPLSGGVLYPKGVHAAVQKVAGFYGSDKLPYFVHPTLSYGVADPYTECSLTCDDHYHPIYCLCSIVPKQPYRFRPVWYRGTLLDIAALNECTSGPYCDGRPRISFSSLFPSASSLFQNFFSFHFMFNEFSLIVSALVLSLSSFYKLGSCSFFLICIFVALNFHVSGFSKGSRTAVDFSVVWLFNVLPRRGSYGMKLLASAPLLSFLSIFAVAATGVPLAFFSVGFLCILQFYCYYTITQSRLAETALLVSSFFFFRISVFVCSIFTGSSEHAAISLLRLSVKIFFSPFSSFVVGARDSARLLISITDGLFGPTFFDFEGRTVISLTFVALLLIMRFNFLVNCSTTRVRGSCYFRSLIAIFNLAPNLLNDLDLLFSSDSFLCEFAYIKFFSILTRLLFVTSNFELVGVSFLINLLYLFSAFNAETMTVMRNTSRSFLPRSIAKIASSSMFSITKSEEKVGYGILLGNQAVTIATEECVVDSTPIAFEAHQGAVSTKIEGMNVFGESGEAGFIKITSSKRFESSENLPLMPPSMWPTVTSLAVLSPGGLTLCVDSFSIGEFSLDVVKLMIEGYEDEIVPGMPVICVCHASGAGPPRTFIGGLIVGVPSFGYALAQLFSASTFSILVEQFERTSFKAVRTTPFIRNDAPPPRSPGLGFVYPEADELSRNYDIEPREIIASDGSVMVIEKKSKYSHPDELLTALNIITNKLTSRNCTKMLDLIREIIWCNFAKDYSDLIYDAILTSAITNSDHNTFIFIISELDPDKVPRAIARAVVRYGEKLKGDAVSAERFGRLISKCILLGLVSFPIARKFIHDLLHSKNKEKVHFAFSMIEGTGPLFSEFGNYIKTFFLLARPKFRKEQILLQFAGPPFVPNKIKELLVQSCSTIVVDSRFNAFGADILKMFKIIFDISPAGREVFRNKKLKRLRLKDLLAVVNHAADEALANGVFDASKFEDGLASRL